MAFPNNAHAHNNRIKSLTFAERPHMKHKTQTVINIRMLSIERHSETWLHLCKMSS